MKEIKISTLKENIELLLKNATGRDSLPLSYLSPATLTQALSKADIEMQITNLPFWEKWENGELEITDEEFIFHVFGSLANYPKKLIVLFDDCFRTGNAYEIDVNNLIAFKNSLDEQSTFLQPFDHIFYFPDGNILILLHHEGKLIKSNLSAKPKNF